MTVTVTAIDKHGVVLKSGDRIAYAQRAGNDAELRVGIVEAFLLHPRWRGLSDDRRAAVKIISDRSGASAIRLGSDVLKIGR